MKHPANKIYAIIVSHYPDAASLGGLIKSLLEQVDAIVVIDNATPSLNIIEGAHFIFLGENKGVAHAQNIGIQWAIEQGASHLMLLDQDSAPHKEMIAQLRRACEVMQDAGHKVAAVGPCYLDSKQNNPPPFIRVNGLRLIRATESPGKNIVSVDYLIASGSLIPVTTIESVGPMLDQLFIDYVDIEWGLRARNLGYESFGVFSAKMHHSLGDDPIKFFWKIIPNHSPLRHYYHIRNALWLYKQPWPPLNWKLVDAYRLLLKYFFYSIFARPRLKHFSMMTLGIWHGLIGKMGKYEPGRPS